MAATGKINSGGIASWAIKIDGSPINDIFSVYSIRVEKMVNRVSRATIVLLDGNPATGKFEASSSSTFVPGGKVSIEAGYDNKNKLIFSGIITGQSVRLDMQTASMLEVECRDEAIKMIVDRKSLTYTKKKDSEIISAVIGTYSGLTSNVTATANTWPEQVQYYVTDWDYILSLAESNGLIVTTINGKISVIKPDADTSPVLTVNYGDTLMEFNADLNAVNQLGQVKASTWDFKNQEIISAQASPSVTGPGNLSTKKLSDVIHSSDYALQTTAPFQSADLTAWSKAQMIKSEYSKITGDAKFQGTSLPEPATYITFGGLGTRFNGDYLLSGVIHNISDGNWLTEVSLGLSPSWFTQNPDVMSPPASGLLPGARGLFNGTVKKMFGDPDSQYRILVTVPLFDTKGEGIWARLSNFYSTNGYGAFFLPEVGDEVILGFLNEDPRYPVILGSMYSNPKQKPFAGLEPADKNPVKAIVSKSGITVKFDDENKEFTITTPGKNKIILSDKDKKITIDDENENTIVMSSGGIEMTSNNDIKITASKNLVLTGKMGVQIAASGGDVELKGVNVKQTANMQYSAQGLTAQVSGSGQLTLKGGMVMIN